MVGLGNPGAEYEGTRHNVGFMVAKLVIEKTGARAKEKTRTYASWQAGDLVVLTPLTYMNRSGEALKEFGARPADLLVVVDDIYLPLGAVRVRAKGGDGGHNGLWSIQESLGTDSYARVRVGVGRAGQGQDLADHVLSGFAPDEADALAEAIETASEACLLWAREGVIPAMNRFNARVRDNAPEGER